MKSRLSDFYLSNTLIAFTLFLFFSACKNNSYEIFLESGKVITHSVKVKPEVYLMNGSNDLKKGVILIEGNDITVDFQNSTLKGSNDKHFPNEYYGLGILIRKGKNITIKNLNVKHYKIGIMADGVENLQIENADLSHNYRQKLKSTRNAENEDDWMSYHNNENDEWLRYGAAAYLKNCDSAIVKQITVNQGQNGLMVVNCNQGLFYNNDLKYNSGVGIGLYRSSNNQILHNKCDWNIRGYSHGVYNRGQDSAGILVYENSHNNTIAYNSATHSGDGFFLWAGQEFMDSGEGGCNNNLVYKNDFSHASNNAVEITFSSNKIIENRLEDSNYGIWGGYSYNTDIWKNTFKNNDHGIAIEHGRNFSICNNIFENDKIGIQLFEREKQPESWGFVKTNPIMSKSYRVYNNNFVNNKFPLQISSTENLDFAYNYFLDFGKLLLEKSQNEYFTFNDNIIFQNSNDKTIENNLGNAKRFFSKKENKIKPKSDVEMVQEDSLPQISVPILPDAKHALLPPKHRRGRKNIIVNEWGPYNFEYPLVWLRKKNTGQYTFAIFGPEGNWKLTGGKGFKNSSRQTGSVPATLVLEKDENFNGNPTIELEFIGSKFVDQFGKENERGRTFHFNYTDI